MAIKILLGIIFFLGFLMYIDKEYVLSNPRKHKCENKLGLVVMMVVTLVVVVIYH